MAPTTRRKRKRQEEEGEDDELEQQLLGYAERGELEGVRALVEIARVNVNCIHTGRDGDTPLMLAAYNGRIQVVRFLLKNGANVHAVTKYGRIALGFALYKGRFAVAELLLEHGANVNSQIYYGDKLYSPLGWAILKRMADMVALLLRFGANTETTLYEGKTYGAVLLACWKSNVEIVRLLLEHNGGVGINTIKSRRNDLPAMSPLCKACYRNKTEIVQLLIQHGARVFFDGAYPDSPSPLVHAIKHFSCLERVRFLLDHSRFSEPVNENACLHDRGAPHPLSPPLETAIRWNKLEVVRLLVERGANANDRPFLWQCANHGCYGISRFLLRAGAKVNRADHDSGETPLWVAASNGNVTFVQKLLEAGADVRIRDNNGETPLGVAHRKGHKRIVYLLLRTSPHVWSKLAEVW